MTATPSAAHALPYFRATSAAPGFSSPIELRMPLGVSAMRYCGLPGRAAGVVPLLTIAPSRETSMSSAYSTPCPNVPEAVITGFFSRRPRAASTSTSTPISGYPAFRARSDLLAPRRPPHLPRTLRWICSPRCAARPSFGIGGRASAVYPDSGGLALGEGDIAETEDGALATHARVAVGGDDDASAADPHRAAHVLLDCYLGFEQSGSPWESPCRAGGFVSELTERGKHRPRSARTHLIRPLQQGSDRVGDSSFDAKRAVLGRGDV